MAGRPLLQTIRKRIHDLGGDDWFFDQIAGGASMKDIADQLGCSRTYLYNWINLDRERRRERLEDARKLAADVLVEEGLEILDSLADPSKMPTPTDARVAESRANYRKWLAGVRNREAYGDKSGQVDVHVSVGSLHLEALRTRGQMPRLEEGDDEDDEVVEADYELVEEGDGEEPQADDEDPLEALR